MNNAFLKVVEGFGLVAGLNEENKKKEFVGGTIVESDYSTRLSVYHFSLFDAYKSVISELRRQARFDKRYDRVTCVHFWGMEERMITDKQIAESYCDDMFFGTVEEYEEMKREERREELEGLAKELAAKFKVKLSSIAFIEKLHEAIDIISGEREQWNNYETRAEEWAACMYSGAGSDTYFDDLNYVNSRYERSSGDLWDILDWLRDECPLLMCKYEEKKMREEEE